MRSVCCAAGAALLAYNIAGFAQTKTPCSQTVGYPLQSRAVLMINSNPADLPTEAPTKVAFLVSCSARRNKTATNVAFHFSPTANGGKLSIEGPHLQHGNNG